MSRCTLLALIFFYFLKRKNKFKIQYILTFFPLFPRAGQPRQTVPNCSSRSNRAKPFRHSLYKKKKPLTLGFMRFCRFANPSHFHSLSSTKHIHINSSEICEFENTRTINRVSNGNRFRRRKATIRHRFPPVEPDLRCWTHHWRPPSVSLLEFFLIHVNRIVPNRFDLVFFQIPIRRRFTT